MKFWKKSKLLCLFLVLALSVSLLSSCTLDGLGQLLSGLVDLGGSEDGGQGTPPVLEGNDIYNKPYYQALTDEEKLFYQTIYTSLAAKNATVEIRASSDDKGDAIFAAFSAVARDNPQLFWLNGGATLNGKVEPLSKKTTYTLSPYILTGYGSIEEMSDAVSQRITAIVEEAKVLPDLYDQILFLHDYLVDSVEYDSDAVDDILEGDGKTVHPSSTSYGAFIEGKAVCSGYAAAFAILVQELNVPCIRVQGRKIGGENHEWNAVYFEGASYFVDVTWDDPLTTGEHDNRSHLYYFINQAELSKTHEIAEGEIVPTCTATAHEYYRHHGYFSESYDYAQFCAIAAKQANKDTVVVRFGSLNALNAAIRHLSEQEKIFSVPALQERLRGKGYSLSHNDTALTSTFFLPD